MMAKNPSSVAARHLLPQGEKEGSSALLPSPLAGEGGSRRLTDEGFAKQQAKRLRKEMTDAERSLWKALRDRRFENYKFRRQVPIGKYIADFACLSHKLIVEVDGSQHEGSATDIMRDAWFSAQGFKILRLWNREMLRDLDGALNSVLAMLENKDDK
jgi:very-short-patch-repair endonuclease